MRGENFIPWEQLEPLIEPGMMASDLEEVLLEKLGLDYRRYCMVFEGVDDVAEALRDGVTIETIEQASDAQVVDQVIA